MDVGGLGAGANKRMGRPACGETGSQTGQRADKRNVADWQRQLTIDQKQTRKGRRGGKAKMLDLSAFLVLFVVVVIVFQAKWQRVAHAASCLVGLPFSAVPRICSAAPSPFLRASHFYPVNVLRTRTTAAVTKYSVGTSFRTCLIIHMPMQPLQRF